MDEQNRLFVRIFGDDNNDGKLLLEDGEKKLAKFVFDTAVSGSGIPATPIAITGSNANDIRNKIEEVIDLFNGGRKNQKAYLKTFEDCKPKIEDLIEKLEKVADAADSNKFWCKSTQLVSAVVGALAAIALIVCPPAVAVAGGVLAVAGVAAGGSCVAEHFLLKAKLKEAEKLIKEINENFKTMSEWFSFPEQLKKSFENLVDAKTLSEINKDIKKFFCKVYEQSKLTVGEFKEQFKEELKKFMKKMSNDEKISKLDDDFRPVVMTFLVVSLIKGRNKLVMDSVRVTFNSVLGGLGFANVGEVVGEFLVGGEVVAEDTMGAFVGKLFAPVALVINVIIAVNAAKELNNPSKLSKQIREAVQEFRTSYRFLESVYKQLKEIKFIEESELKEEDWQKFIVLNVPQGALQVAIKRAVKNHLPKEAHCCIKLERQGTEGNHWNVSVPKTHSQELSKQVSLRINETTCMLMK